MRAYVARLVGNSSVIAAHEPANLDDVPESAAESANDREDDDVMPIDYVVDYFYDQDGNGEGPLPA